MFTATEPFSRSGSSALFALKVGGPCHSCLMSKDSGTHKAIGGVYIHNTCIVSGILQETTIGMTYRLMTVGRAAGSDQYNPRLLALQQSRHLLSSRQLHCDRSRAMLAMQVKRGQKRVRHCLES